MSRPWAIKDLISHLREELAGHPVMVVPRIRQTLEKAPWGELLLHCRLRYRDGVLYLYAPSAAARQELSYRTHEIKAILQEMLPEVSLKRIVIR